MKRRKVKINKKAKREIDRYPLVEVHWYDIVSDSNWQSITACKKAKLYLKRMKAPLMRLQTQH